MSNSILAIDAGNSRLKFGQFVPGRKASYISDEPAEANPLDDFDLFPQCGQFMAIPVDDSIPWSTLAEWQPQQTAISGSNPKAIDRVLKEWPRADLPAPLVIRDRSLIPIDLDVDFPEKVGIDRLLDGVAANALKPANKSVIVIDSGTATTVNFVSQRGVFCGGAILPGLEMSAKALNHYTAVLPLVPVHEMGGALPVAPGRNTREAIRNGLFWGQVGGIRELIQQICVEQRLTRPVQGFRYDEPDSPWLILTGGGAPVIGSQFPEALSIASLGMHGLVLTAWKQGT